MTNQKFISNRKVSVIMIMKNMQIVKKKIIFKENDYFMAIKTSRVIIPTAVMTEFKLHMGINSTMQMF